MGVRETLLSKLRSSACSANHRLFIVEGPPCSGKSTMSAHVAELIEKTQPVCYFDEGSLRHPADYEFHALAPAGLLFPESRIVSLADYDGDLLEQLIPYKIYDMLPWETEMPLMLDKWRQFVCDAKADTVYVFNSVFLQNPMCETMMRFGFPEEESLRYIRQIAEIILPLKPVVIYLKNEELAASVQRAAAQRPGWLDAVIAYHAQGAYGQSIGAEGFEGYIRCLEERQKRELRILSKLGLPYRIVDNPQRDWEAAKRRIETYLAEVI